MIEFLKNKEYNRAIPINILKLKRYIFNDRKEKS